MADTAVSMVMELSNDSMMMFSEGSEDVATVAMTEDNGAPSGIRKDRIPFVVFGCVGVIGNLIVILTLGSKREVRKKVSFYFITTGQL